MAVSASLEHTTGEGEPAQDSSRWSRSGIAPPPFTAPRVVDVVCRVDPLCDYLLWVLYRQDRFNRRPPVPPGKPVTERYGHFPQFAAACGAQEPAAALALLPEYGREELAR